MVLYGIGESRLIIEALKKEGLGVVAMARTDYGERLAGVCGADMVVPVPPDAGGFSQVINQLGVTQVIDATHPFASPLSNAARDICASGNIPYIRFGRGETDIPASPLVCRVYSWEEAAERASGYGGSVFLTTGSNNLEIFISHGSLKGKRIVVRVIPEHKVIKKCQDLGVSPRDIVAIQGPFSVKLNKVLFQAYKAGVVVTRDGGPTGGTYNKVRAAADLKIPVILIQREKLQDPDICYDLVMLIEKVTKINDIKNRMCIY
ncbi:MAG: precorrin-6A reductase [Bacillota bacterium]